MNLAELVQTIACIPNMLILSMSLSLALVLLQWSSRITLSWCQDSPRLKTSQTLRVFSVDLRYPDMIVITMIDRYCLDEWVFLHLCHFLHLLSSRRVAQEAAQWALNKLFLERLSFLLNNQQGSQHSSFSMLKKKSFQCFFPFTCRRCLRFHTNARLSCKK